ncbi:hypothetical protein SUGI_0894670 [Cryptomeria japonica]|nr:hypothetical protein SUGI_0894670 [Cryptomeria japonica]
MRVNIQSSTDQLGLHLGRCCSFHNHPSLQFEKMGCISSAQVHDKEYGEPGSQFQHLCDVWKDIPGAHNCYGLLHPMDPILKAEVLRYRNPCKGLL